MIEDLLNRQIDSKKQALGIGGFKLFARMRETTEFKSRAPTTYLENGSPVQDHIINEPLTISIEGDVGDVYIEKTAIESRVNRVNEILGQSAEYLPDRTISQIQKLNGAVNTFRDKIREIDRAVSTGKQILGLEQGGSTPQEQFIAFMEAFHDSKLVISIDMQYRSYYPMRITTLSIVKDSSGNALRFNMSAQKIRVAEPIYILNSEFKKNAAGSVSDQVGGQTDKGNQSGEEVEQSLLNRVVNLTGSFFGG